MFRLKVKPLDRVHGRQLIHQKGFFWGGRGTIFQGFGVLELKVFTLYFNFEFIMLTLNIKEMVVLSLERLTAFPKL